MERAHISKWWTLFMAVTLCFTFTYYNEAHAFGGGSEDDVEEVDDRQPPQQGGNEEDEQEDDIGGGDVLIQARWIGRHSDAANWSEYVIENLPEYGRDLIQRRPSDIRSFCPAYDSLNDNQKMNVWLRILSGMSELESSHNPKTKYTEAFTDGQGRRVISRGLLQLSIESANGYRCGFRSAEELHDPYLNLRCGMIILNRWVGRDGAISTKVSGKWRGGARYWSVLRTSSKITKIKNWTKQMSLCQ